MLLLNSLASLIDKLGGKGLPWRIMGEAVVLALPALLVLTLPMAVLSATLYAYGQLAADMELVAMYANGISVWRMVRPALYGAFGVAVINFILFDQFVPRSNARYKALLTDVQQAHPTLALKPKQLNSLSPTAYFLLADSIQDDGTVRKVTIYDLGGFNSGQRVVHADSGYMKMAPGGSDMFLTLYHGEILEFPRQPPGQPQGQVQRTAFMSDRFRLRNVTNQMQRSADQIRGRGDRELSGCELLDGIVDESWYVGNGTAQREALTRRDLRRLAGLPASPPASVAPKPRVVKHCGIYRRGEEWLEKRILSPSALAAKAEDSLQAERDEIISQAELAHAAAEVQPPPPPHDTAAATVLSIKDTTQHPGPPPALFRSAGGEDIPVPPDLIAMHDSLRRFQPGDTVRPPAPAPQPLPTRELTTTWNDVLSARLEVKGAELQVAAYQVEYHKKWAIPLSSFCFVLLGLALALKNPRGGIGLVIGGSLVIFTIFYVLIIGGENLAKKLYIDPVMAMEGPLIAFTLFGLLSVAAANREMGAARSGGMFDGLFRLFRRRQSSRP
jgi:lipopolysaccharide export system permease protein